MKVRPTIIVWLGGFLLTASLLSPKHLNAQAAPGQLQQQSQTQPPQPAAKSEQTQVPTTLAGPWQLNRDESDNPQQKIRAAEESNRNSNPGRNPAGGYPGGGYPGSGSPGGGYPRGGSPTGGYPTGGYPGRDPRGGNPYPDPGAGGGGGGSDEGGRRSARDIEDDPKMQTLIHPSDWLSIGVQKPEVDVTDDQSRKLIFYTDGRKLRKSKEDKQQEITAHWTGSRLMSDENSPLGGKMSRTFELSQDGRKLFETLRIDNGRSSAPLVIRYVYEAADSNVQSDRNSGSSRPQLKRNPDDANSSSQ